MTTDPEADTLPNMLAALSGQGIYNISFVEDYLPKYGLTYTRDDDKLRFGKASTVLGSRSPKTVAGEEEDTVVDMDKAEVLVFDAIDLSQAILRLIAPNQAPAGASYNRNLQYKADVALITTLWKS